MQLQFDKAVALMPCGVLKGGHKNLATNFGSVARWPTLQADIPLKWAIGAKLNPTHIQS